MKTFIMILILLLSASSMFSQETERREPWHSFRTINGHSVETVWVHYLEFTVSHRFLGTVDTGIDEFFGLDQSSNTRLGLAYGVTNDLTVGIGRSSRNKVYDTFLKYRILEQRSNQFPATVTLLGATQIMTRPWTDTQEAATKTSHRMSYVSQVLIAHRLTENISLQISPTLIHRNLVEESVESNTAGALGLALRWQITETTTIQSEYYRRLTRDPLELRTVYDVFGIAIDFSTAKHAFQLQFTNNVDLTEADFLSNTQDDFFSNGIHFGFHIARKFGL